MDPWKPGCTGHLTCPLPSALSIFPSLEVPWLPSSRCAVSSAPGTFQKLSQYLPHVLWVSMPAFLLEPTPSVHSSTISLLGSWTALVPNSWTSPKIHFIFGIFPGMHLTGNMFSKKVNIWVWTPLFLRLRNKRPKAIYIYNHIHIHMSTYTHIYDSLHLCTSTSTHENLVFQTRLTMDHISPPKIINESSKHIYSSMHFTELSRRMYWTQGKALMVQYLVTQGWPSSAANSNLLGL